MNKLFKENRLNVKTQIEEESIEKSLKILCSYRATKEIECKCHISTKRKEVATGGTYFISHAEEDQINQGIRRLLKCGYIRPSTLTRLNKLKLVIKPNCDLSITLNLINLN